MLRRGPHSSSLGPALGWSQWLAWQGAGGGGRSAEAAGDEGVISASIDGRREASVVIGGPASKAAVDSERTTLKLGRLGSDKTPVLVLNTTVCLSNAAQRLVMRTAGSTNLSRIVSAHPCPALGRRRQSAA